MVVYELIYEEGTFMFGVSDILLFKTNVNNQIYTFIYGKICVYFSLEY